MTIDKDGKPVTTSGGIWAGTGGEQIGGDNVPLNYADTVKRFPTGINRNGLSVAQWQAILTAQQQAQQLAQNPATANGFDLQAFISENRLLVLGGIALILYFTFGKSGNLAEKTVVTRYNKR